jgi:predicted RecB family nuclease
MLKIAQSVHLCWQSVGFSENAFLAAERAQKEAKKMNAVAALRIFRNMEIQCSFNLLSAHKNSKCSNECVSFSNFIINPMYL